MSAPEQQAPEPQQPEPEPQPDAQPLPPVPPLPEQPPGPAPVSRWASLSRNAAMAVGAGMGAAAVGLCWMLVALTGTSEAEGGTATKGSQTSPPTAAGQDEKAKDAEETSTPFSTDGTLTVTNAGAGVKIGDVCSGTGGYDDIHLGTQVTVTDADGTLVAMGMLLFGEKTEAGCEFAFTVDDITPGSKFYTVEVSHRGGLTQTEEDLRAGGLAFSLGSD
ncbi:hypothetical protein ABT026_28320 [Streptomyces sp. NPDC002734]|uniref:hypothetical protein n=1 Tax=Streptomyces sp. NPDC002734 TaxID=3154426 RepID=UPI0033278339